MSDATDRLRERMQNEQTSLALSELLRNNRAELITLRAENTALREALTAFAEHFGPLEDNHMLAPEVRHCFALARAILEKTT